MAAPPPPPTARRKENPPVVAASPCTPPSTGRKELLFPLHLLSLSGWFPPEAGHGQGGTEARCDESPLGLLPRCDRDLSIWLQPQKIWFWMATVRRCEEVTLSRRRSREASVLCSLGHFLPSHSHYFFNFYFKLNGTYYFLIFTLNECHY
jgi:hypothetical protein